MFRIKIAGLIIEIHNKYEYLEDHCCEYMIDDQNNYISPDIVVESTDQEILDKQLEFVEFYDGEKKPSLGYCESWIVNQKNGDQMVYFDGFLMHAAVISVDGKAYMFAAASGTGKSTHIKLWKDLLGDRAQIVNGDKPILRVFNNELCACGTPWCGKESWNSNIIVPVKALCFIEQDTVNRIKKVSKEEALERIFQRLWIPNDLETASRYLDLVNQLIMQVDCWCLGCNMEIDSAVLSYQTMSQTEDHTEENEAWI